MKALKILSITALSLLSNLVIGQDTIYVYQKVGGILKIPTNNVDSIIFYDTTSIALDTSITDADGNVYTSVTIGTQEWMAENLRTSKYSDGTTIPNVTSVNEWTIDTTGAWCHINNDNQYDTIYGKLYNWYAVETGKLCPTGWHVPTDAEWTVLTDYLASDGHSEAEGTALKSTSGWNSGGNGTDDYGWNGLPGDHRLQSGEHGGVGNAGYWWSSSQHDNYGAWYRYLVYDSENLFRQPWGISWGFSVRCLRD